MGIQKDRSRAISKNRTKIHELSPPPIPFKIRYKQELNQEFPLVKSEFSIIIRYHIGFTYNAFKPFTELDLLEPHSLSSQAVAGSLSEERIMFLSASKEHETRGFTNLDFLIALLGLVTQNLN